MSGMRERVILEGVCWSGSGVYSKLLAGLGVSHGFLGRGLPLGVLVAVVIELALGHAFPEALRAPVFWVRLAALVALFTATGCLRAQVTWNAY